jgi:hypothetical protein
MKIETSEAEILGLLTKTEEEQIEYLYIENNIMKNRWDIANGDNLTVEESLPDLAERLWRKAYTIGHIPGIGDVFLSAIKEVHKIIFPKNYGQVEMEEWMYFWALEAKPIHRIVAALLAIKRAGVEI